MYFFVISSFYPLVLCVLPLVLFFCNLFGFCVCTYPEGTARQRISGWTVLACVVMNVGALPPEGQVEEGNNNKVGWERLKMINDQVARTRRGEPGIEEIKRRERKVSGEKS